MNLSEINIERFNNALNYTVKNISSIGTYNEKLLHAVLKTYIEPDEDYHEVRIGRFIADIARENEVTEIQTASVYRIRKKLEHLLEYNNVTLVYPVIEKRYIVRINEDTGKIVSERLSSRRGKPIEAFNELYSIKDFLLRDNFFLWFPEIDVSDIRSEIKGRNRRGTKLQCVPRRLTGATYISNKCGYLQLLPNLPDEFTTADIAFIARCNIKTAQCAANVLNSIGIFEKTGMKGKSFVYKLSSNCISSCGESII